MKTSVTITLPNGTTTTGEIELTDTQVASLQKGGRWKPEISDSYYYVSARGEVSVSEWYGGSFGKWQYLQHNCYRTEQEAQDHLEYLKALAVVRDDAGDFEPDWNDETLQKYSVYYDHGVKKLSVDYVTYTQDMRIYFESEEAAQASIDTHKDSWLRVFGIKVGEK